MADIVVFDNGSSDPNHRGYLQEMRNSGVLSDLIMMDPVPLAENKREADSRCGEQRKRIVDYFLEREEYEYLFLQDDDVLTTGESIDDAVRDYRMLDAIPGRLPGGICLHSWLEPTLPQDIDGKRFCLVKLTGESALLTHRSVFETVGNHFGPHEKGYADTHWEALRKHNLMYYTRVDPPYEAQHVGIGDGSMCQLIRRKPFWVKDLWRMHTKNKPYLKLRCFEAGEFYQMVRKSGCEKACEEYYGVVLSKMKGGEITRPMTPSPPVPPIPFSSEFPRSGSSLGIRVYKVGENREGLVNLPDGRKGRVVKEYRL